MPAVIFFACLDLEQKSSFMDGHEFEKNIITVAIVVLEKIFNS